MESPGAVFSALLNVADTIHSGFARFPGTRIEKHSHTRGVLEIAYLPYRIFTMI